MRRLHRFMPVFIVLGIAIFLVLNVIITINIYDKRSKSQRLGKRYLESSMNGGVDGFDVMFGDKPCGVPCGKAKDSKLSSDRASVKTNSGENSFSPVIVNDIDDSNNESPSHTTISTVGKQLDRAEVRYKFTELVSNDDCPVYQLNNKYLRHGSQQKVSCKPHRPSSEACVFAEKQYPFDPSLLKCKNSQTVEFCKFKRSGGISCIFPTMCKSIEVHGVDLGTGKIRIRGAFSSRKRLEKGLLKILHTTAESGLNFLFISCVPHNGTVDSPQQLFTWFTPITQKHLKRPAINMNIVLLDSVSRSHFYRSLPKLIDEFKRINSDKDSGGEVLDFISFQSLHGHSAENAHALFSGSVFPNNITNYQRERAPIGIDVLYKQFKDAGYVTMYQDDLCWSGIWGLRMELGLPKTWKGFWRKVKDSFIDNTGLSVASCNILKSLGLENPFGKTEGNQICFNGQFQHDFWLRYAEMWHKYARGATISYTALNVAHDSRGIRTQTLNLGLVSHVQEMLQSDKTITVFLADHGNTYTSYVRKILEGRYEMYHPSLFMLIPDGVKDILGEEIMDTLRGNQNRLVTMLDLNAGFRWIAELAANLKWSENRGIFGEIPPERTCNDLPLKLPNFCVCEGWDNVVSNDSTQMAVLEFGVGYLNSEIDRQWRQHRDSILETSFDAEDNIPIARKCHHLVPIRFENVHERNSGETLITSFDFVVAAGEGVDHKEDTFHVETQSNIRPGVTENYLKMLSFDRISPYGPYEACGDKGIRPLLCVCSMKSRVAKNGLSYIGQKSISNLWQYMPNLSGIPSKKTLFNKKKDNCIYIISRDYYVVSSKGKIDETSIGGAILEALNICPNQSFLVRIQLHPTFMKVSGKRLFSAIVHENSLKMLTVLATENFSWRTSYRFDYEVLQF
eukprot:gene2167-17757_t